MSLLKYLELCHCSECRNLKKRPDFSGGIPVFAGMTISIEYTISTTSYSY